MIDIHPETQPVAYIIWRMAKAWGLAPDDLFEPGTGGNYQSSPLPPVTVCRHLAMMVAHDLLPETPWSELGLRFRRDPTTVRSNVMAARRYLAEHRLVGARVLLLKAEIAHMIGSHGANDEAFQTAAKGAVSST